MENSRHFCLKLRFCYCCLVGLIVIGALWTAAGSYAALAKAPPPAHAKTAGDLPNFSTVAPGLYRGAAPTAAGLIKLKEMGVRTIIDLRIENHGQTDEVKEAKQLGLEHVRIRLGAEAPTKKQVAEFLSIVNDPAKQPVFVHCQYGADRTGAMIGIYRVTQEHWTFDRAYAEMRKYGFKSFLTQLKGAVRERAMENGHK